MNECEDEFICDLAETYSVLDMRGLSPSKVAILLFGLRDNSRTKMYLSGAKLTIDQTLLAIIADALQFIAWSKTKDAQRGKYDKKSILKILNGEYKKENDDLISFTTIEDFETYMQQFKVNK